MNTAAPNPAPKGDDPLVSDLDVAIIGMAGRFPGAGNITEFWRNLCAGVDSTTVLSDDDLRAAVAAYDPLNAPFVAREMQNPNYVRAKPLLDGIDQFDAVFFGYNPREAELLDPQQRIFLECAWEALENAGYDPETYQGLIGLYGGANLSLYYTVNLRSHPDLIHSPRLLLLQLGNQNDYLTTRVSYKLNLTGPSVNVQCACSTSLVAMHLARQSLLSGECDMALAGGVLVRVPQREGYLYEEGGMVSPDGRCRAFDAQANGTVFSGGGAGLVVLKRLPDALVDGDHIYAVVKGSAVNNDGLGKAGYTAPSIAGQARTVAEALAVAEVDPVTIGYVEAHGTGTPLGDPVEIAALTQVFQAHTKRRGFCAVGSVKTNIGHLSTAAGVASLIKTALALYHKQVPPSLHFEQPNPRIDLARSPFYINTRLADWPAPAGDAEGTPGPPRRAGVSAFGVGGTNAHAILEEAPPRPEDRRVPARPWQVLPLAARTASALETATANLADHLRQHPDLDLADVAYTLQVGRRAFPHRRIVVCRDPADAVQALETRDPRRVLTLTADPPLRPVVFMFSGQGAQYGQMGRELYESEVLFRAAVDRCAALLQPHLGCDLRAVLYPDPEQAEAAARQLDQTWLTQPALFVIEYALAQLWLAWGVRPQALIGHSIGEYVAACLAGVFALEDALALVALRGRLMQALPGGAMLAVAVPAPELAARLTPDLALAASNGPVASVASGPTEAVARLEAELTAVGVACRRLHTSHAFHSAMMDPILEQFTAQVRAVPLHPPTIPIISNVTGTWLTTEEATDPAYWARHLRHTVRFSEGLQELARAPGRILLEVGPGRTLCTLATQHKKPDQVVLASLRHPQDAEPDLRFLLTTLGRLWGVGVPVAWPAVAGAGRRRVPLPTYPFERQRYWIEPNTQGAGTTLPAPAGRKPDLADWFYIPSWQRSLPPALPPADPVARSPWLVFADDEGLGARLVERLERLGRPVIRVSAAAEFQPLGERAYTLNPGTAADYDRLAQALHEQGQLPGTVAHLWSVCAAPPAGDAPRPGGHPGLAGWEEAQARGFYSLLYLAQALGRLDVTAPLRLLVVSNNMHEVTGDAVVAPARSTILGPCKIIPQEYPHIRCRNVDLILPAPGSPPEQALLDRLIGEAEDPLSAGGDDLVVAYRQGHRWVQTIAPLRLESVLPDRARLRDGGVYLITGGLGGIGLVLAEYLARAHRARLVLVGRSALPPRAEWERRLAQQGEPDPVRRRIRQVLGLEQLGAEVLVVAADVTDPQQMRAALAQAEARFGALHGVIHAAGLPGGGMIQLKMPANAAAVLAPKVAGALVLEEVLQGRALDFLVFCSSVYALLPTIGQVDYCGANNFLDLFAHYYAARYGIFAVAINWGGWGEVGMAVNPAGESGRSTPSASVDHTLLDRCLVATADWRVFLRELRVASDWLLAEHRLMGQGALPGTGYLEMARAALPPDGAPGPVELRDVFFVSPLRLGDDESRDLLIVLKGDRSGFEFSVLSALPADDGAAPRWAQHALGHAGYRPSRVAPSYDIEALRRQGNLQRVTPGTAEEGSATRLVTFGPRWQSLRQVDLGAQEALALLELPEAFATELASLALHPALLDVATSYAIRYFGQDAYLPLSYGAVRIYRPLPRRIYSYVRCAPDTSPRNETITFDITILDERGATLVEIEEFTMRKVRDPALVTALPAESERRLAPDQDPTRIAAVAQYYRMAGQANPAQDGIRSAEGVEAFLRILSRQPLPQIVVTPRDLPAALRQAHPPARSGEPEPAAAEEPRVLSPRPDGAPPYVAPRTDVESRLAGIWQKVLGLAQISIHDNFFEAGGDSVLAIQIVARAKQTGLPLTPNQLFQHPTVAELAAILDGATGPPPGPEDTPPPAPDPEPPAPRRTEDAADYTPADFPYAQLSQAELDRLLDKLR